MPWRLFYTVPLRLRSLFRRAQVESELDEELSLHLEQQIGSEIVRGKSPQEARYIALRRMGGLEQLKEECRDMRHMNVADNLMRDVRYAVRMLARSPGFSIAALLALSLGIGVNTAMYSIVHAVILRPLGVREPDRLIRVYESNPSRNQLAFSASVRNYLSWREQARSLDLAAFQGYAANLTQNDEPERLEGMAATSSFLPVVGMTMWAGRWFHDEEERAGQHRVVVLSEGLWATRFGRDPGVLGRKLLLNGEPFSVVGVASQRLTIPLAPDLWVPLVMDPNASRGNRQYTVVGRLRPAVTVQQAQSEMVSIAGSLEREFPESNKGWSVSLVPLMRWLVPAEIRTALLVLLGAVGMVLLIACANVANLLVARAEARRKELAIRAAMGAGASRISQQLLTESLMLALLGGALGVALGYSTVGVARRSLLEIVPRADEISIDLTVLGFALSMSVITGLLFGSTPILQLGKMRTFDALHQAGRASQPAPRSRLRAMLVIAQLSLATVLLIGAGLLLQSFARLQGVSLGLDPDSVLTARISLPRVRYPDAATIATVFSRLTDTLQSAPGVQAVGVSNGIPFGPGSTIAGTAVAIGAPDSVPVQATNCGWRSVDGGYFAALRIPLLRGRVFDPEGSPGKRPVFVLSQQAALSLYGATDPVGRQLRLNDAVGEVIGVVGDVHMKSVSDPPERIVYLPISQGGRFGAFAVFVKTRGGSPEAAANVIRERLREIDSTVPAYGFRAMNDWIDMSSARTRIRTYMLALLAAVALVLGMIGIYGVLAYLVTLRRHEFGVRLALGAPPDSLLRLVLGQGLGLAAIGIAMGLVGAVMLTRVLETLLFRVSTRDPVTFVGVAVVLLLAALIACYAPARRAAGADPIAALRAD
jgi:putative ABC transport system permease protein